MKTTTYKNFTIAVLSSVEKTFLKMYTPSDDMVTSISEIRLVEKVLDLNGLTSEELQYKRNAVVLYYSELGKEEFAKYNKRTEKSYAYSTAMQSVTAVIDNRKYNA